ncbi:uncharacterized protein LOC135081544 isoform X5 [Ostrinia nubilalis]|uniref:uncharacterized protein LOC135081544 isoform X5 n=1 Tax=Ostrinia nubilalis TaxID=29057 RepID=UPI003082462C
MAAPAPAASCMSTEHGCVMFDCLVHLWEWLDPPVVQSQYPMENKKQAPATQQPLTQQHLMAHHVHPDQIYATQNTQLAAHLTSAQAGQIQPNGVMHQLLQSQYHSNMNARSPLLENRHDLYGTGHNHEYARHYGANDNYYPQSPPRMERNEVHTDHNVNHELLQNIPKGYNAEVYQDYLKRNPPRDTNQIYQNHQPMYRPNVNQYGSKPYLPYSSRIGPQSNTEILRRQYNEIQQMKLQQQLHYQNQAQMQQQQKFAERQLLLQQIHGVQPPPNLQNSIYSDESYRDLDRYGSKNDFKEYSSPDLQKDIDRYAKNNEYRDIEQQNRHYAESQWQSNQQTDFREIERQRRQSEGDKGKSQSPPSDLNNQSQKNNIGVISPMKSSESSSPSVKSPSSDSRRSSGGNQALRSPIAQRIPTAPVTMSGILYKQGSDGLKVWRKRWFVLSEYCLFYYKSQDEEKLLGSVLLPSYKVSACTAEDKVLRKFAFKLEHANMRTYILAAPDQESMLNWVKSLTMAALMQSPNEQPQKQSDRTAAKTEEGDDIPTYANAPPKPRRSNEGYNSPSPDMYDPNYDLLKKPASSHYSQGPNHPRYQEHTNYGSPNQESTYTLSPQSPPPQQPMYQAKRPYDSHNLSLPLTNSANDRQDNNQPNTSNMYRSNPQSPYFNNRTRNQQQQQVPQEMKQDQIYDRQPQRNPFLQDNTPQMETPPKENEAQIKNNRMHMEQDRMQQNYNNETYGETRSNQKINAEMNPYNREVYGELNSRPNKVQAGINERLLIERRTPDAYGRSNTMAAYNKPGPKVGDYEDVYGTYAVENEYGKAYAKSPNTTQSNHQQSAEYGTAYPQEKTFSGPAILRRKKMQSSGIQPPMPRPHSADFLEYESKNEMLNKTMPTRTTADPPKQPQRPKSSLDINSYYDPSSDRYYSEESYAEKMRQSAQYLQAGMAPRNIQIPLAKYASGLAEKQLSSAYSQITNNNYEPEFSANKVPRENASFSAKYGDLEGLNSNWTLKEKNLENQKEYLYRSGSVMSDGSNVSAYTKDMNRFEQSADSFMRSASARLPSSGNEKEGEKKVQQVNDYPREESMKRLLEWKQRMLQSPLTRKSTPATISLARSLNQSRQSLRSDQYKSKTYTNASYNSYSSDDEASMTMAGTNMDPGSNNNTVNQQTLSKKAFLGSNTSIGRTNRDTNIPVRAVSPRVRWVEEKPINDTYGSQQMSNSQQNLHTLTATEDSWATARSPSRASQQPIRAVSPRVRRNTENDDLQREGRRQGDQLSEVPTAGELLGRTHEELVLLLIQLRRRHAATHRAIEQCRAQISSIEDSLSSLKAMEREENLQRLEQLRMQLMELEHQYEKSKPLVQLVDNMVKLGSLYNRPGSTVERLERNQRLRQKVLAEHALEQQRWLESAAAGKPLETEAARARVAELWALEQELADEAAILQGLKTDKDAIESLLTGVRGKLDSVPRGDLPPRVVNQPPPQAPGLEAELARVHAMLAHNSKKLEQTVADNARLERELQQLRRALQARRAAVPAHPTAMLEDEVSRVQQLVSALQRQRQELSRAVRHLTQQSHALQTTHDSMPGKRRPQSSWQETNLDTGHTIDHGQSDYDYEMTGPLLPPGHYDHNMETPLYVDTRAGGGDVISPLNSEDMQHGGFGNLSNVEKQEIKTVRIVKRESERRQRDRERSLQPMSDWPNHNITANLDQFIEEELVTSLNYARTSSVPMNDYNKLEDYCNKQRVQQEPPNYLRLNDRNMELSPKYPSSPSLSNYDYSRDMSSLSSSYQKSYDRSLYDRTVSLSTQYLNSPTDSSRTLTNDPMSKTSSIVSLTRSHMELSPIFKSEAAKQIITEMSGEPKTGSLHRRQVPKEKRRHYTAPHHLSAKTLNELPKDAYNQDKMGRSLDDADMERALRTAPAPDVVRSALPAQATRLADSTIDQLLAAPQKILIPERYIPEKPPELSPEEQQKRQEKVESIKKMLTSSSADPSKSPDCEEKRQREHLLQMNQILAKQVTEMSKIIAVKALEELPQNTNDDLDDRSPDVELPIYQQRDNFFT